MNLKSNVLKIAVVIALIIMLVPVIAAEDTSANAESVDENGDVISEDIDDDDLSDEDDGDDETDDEDDEADDEDDEELDDDDEIPVTGHAKGSADLKVSTFSDPEQVRVGELANFGILVENLGPDTASNVIVRFGFITGDVRLLAAQATKGTFDTLHGIWYVGDLAAGESAALAMVGQVLSSEHVTLMAIATSDTPDPDLSNNVAFSVVDVVGDVEKTQSSNELPATGNPIALAVLALLSCVGLSFRRRL